MPLLRNLKTGNVEDIPDDSARNFLASGEWELAEGARTVVDRGEGSVFSVPTASAHEGAYQNLAVEDEAAAAERELDVYYEDEYGGVTGGLAAFGVGAARGLTLGLSDAALRGLGVEADELEGLRRAQRAASLAGEVVGAAAPALVSSGAGAAGLLARTPAGLVARAGGRVAQLGARGGVAGRVAAGAAGGAVEGAAFGGGQALSDAIIQDKPLTAEAFVASVGSGALYGGIFGAGAEVATAAGSAVATGVKRIASKAEDVAESVARRVDEAVGRRLRSTEDILKPGPRIASAEDLVALRRVGDDAATEAAALLGARAVPASRKAILSQRVDDLTLAAKALDAVPDAGADVAQHADAVTRYHRAADAIAGDVAKAGGRRFEVPTNPVARIETDHGAVSTVRDLVPDVSATARSKVKAELRAEVDRLDVGATPLIEEARRIVAAHKPVEDMIGGQTLAELLGEAEGSAKLAGLVKRAEDAQAAFQKTFGVGAAPAAQLSMFAGKTSDDVLEGLLSSSQAELDAAGKTLIRYHKATSDLAAELDAIAPNAAAPPRVAQLSAPSFARGGKTGAKPFEGGWDAGDVLALADLAGMSIEDMPLVGQIPGLDKLLTARLAYRRVKGGLEKVRLAGASAKVGGIAARARTVRDGLERAVKSFVSAGAARVKRAAVPTVTTILHSVSYTGDDVPEDETKVDAFRRISGELAEVTRDPARLDDGLRKRLDLAIPELVDPILEAARRKVLYLAGVIPKDPRDPAVLQSRWEPDDLELDEFADRVRAAEDPASVFSQMEAGRLTPQAAETLREVYPALFTTLQQRLIEEIGDTQADIPHDRQVQLSVLLDVPISATEDPAFIAAMQEGYAPQQPGPKPGTQPRLAGIDRMTFEGTAAEESGF